MSVLTWSTDYRSVWARYWWTFCWISLIEETFNITVEYLSPYISIQLFLHFGEKRALLKLAQVNFSTCKWRTLLKMKADPTEPTEVLIQLTQWLTTFLVLWRHKSTFLLYKENVRMNDHRNNYAWIIFYSFYFNGGFFGRSEKDVNVFLLFISQYQCDFYVGKKFG